MREDRITPAGLQVGGRYNWRHQAERLVYVGAKHYPGDRRTWHQFAKVESPSVVWSEVLNEDLAMFEATPTPDPIRTGGAS